VSQSPAAASAGASPTAGISRSALIVRIVFALAILAFLAVNVVRTGTGIASTLASIGVGLWLAMAGSYVVLWFSRLRILRIQTALPPGTWSSMCVRPTAPQKALVLSVDKAAVALRSSATGVVAQWRLKEIRAVERTTLQVGLFKRTAVTMTLTGGERVDLLFPGPSRLRFPDALADTAAAQLSRSAGR